MTYICTSLFYIFGGNMETRFLFPNKCKKFGTLALVFSFAFFLAVLFFDEEFILKFPVFAIWSLGNAENASVFGFVQHDVTGTISGILLLLSLVVAAFSKEKIEDEYIAKLRLESLIWAVYVNCAFLLFCLLFFYGWPFAAMLLINFYSILFLFIIKFRYSLWKARKAEEK
jgi:hypothetical protein